jgi:hypothetical protein
MELGQVRTHEGVCDASAAVFLHGSTHFLVANDEDQDRTILREYDAEGDGPPVREFVLDPKLLKPDKDDPEIDLEGSAWMNGRIWWIGSHSRSKKAKKRESRHRLFATELRDGVPVIVGEPYCNLIKDLGKFLGLTLDTKDSPKEGGVSIEGLSASPQSGELLIGFRSPLLDGRALIASLRNPQAVIDGSAEPCFGKPVMLDLGGLGLRSIDYWPDRRQFLLVAGSAGDGDEEPRLLRWDGEGKPQEIDMDLSAAGAPEGLCIEERSGTVYLLFDEGNTKSDGVKCKDSERKQFRSVSLRGL